MITVDLFSGTGGLTLGCERAGFEVVAAFDFWDKAVLNYNANFSHPCFQFDLSDHESAAKAISPYAPEVIVGGPPCFPAGTAILTDQGMKPIEAIRVGDVVLTHRNRWRRVVATMLTPDVPTVVVSGQGAHLETTPEHPFYAARKRLGEAEWIEAKDLTGCYWSTPTKVAPVEADLFSQSPEFYEFVGRWVGDGWLRTDKRHGRKTNRAVVVLCSNKNEREDVCAILERANIKFGESEERTTSRFCIYSKELCSWLEKHFGRGAGGKTIPAWLFSQSEEIRRAFLNGLVSADGSIAEQPRGGAQYKRVTTINRNLAAGIRLLATSLGMSASVSRWYSSKSDLIEERKVNCKPFAVVSMFENSRKGYTADERFYGRVRKVEPSGETKVVYNFEVEEDNSYVADGFIVHNCQEFSSAGKRVEDAKADLTPAFAKTVSAIRPRWFIMENVERATLSQAYQRARTILKDAGYGLSENVLDASLCGVPQKRKRFFCVGRLGAEDGFLDDALTSGFSEKPMTLRDYFGDSLGIQHYYRHPRSYARRGIFSIDEPSPTVRGVNRPIPEDYKRHDGDTADPLTVRPLTTEERAQIQTFPADFKWVGSKTAKEQMIGNAVPVNLAYYVASRVMQHERKI